MRSGNGATTEGHLPIDASGTLPDGTKFDGPAEFRKVLLSHRDEFVRTLHGEALTYALGRGVEYYDMPAVRAIMREAAPSDYRWSSLILGIVKSAALSDAKSGARGRDRRRSSAVGPGQPPCVQGA